MDNQRIKDYLEGRQAERVSFRSIFSTADAGPDLNMQRQTLAREGPDIIVPVLQMTLPSMRIVGQRLAAVMKKSAELARAGKEDQRDFQSEMDAGRPVDGIFFRTRDLIREIATASPHQGDLAGMRIVRVLIGNDQELCILAALHSATEGIPHDAIVGGLLHVYSQETPPLVRIAVSIGLLGYLETLNETIANAAMMNVAQFAKGKVYNGLPALVYRVKNEYLKNEDLMDQDMLIAKLAMYYLLLANSYNI